MITIITHIMTINTKHLTLIKVRLRNILIVSTSINVIAYHLSNNSNEYDFTVSNNNFYTYYQQMNTIPDTIYPEILIIIDYELLVNIGEDKIIIYLIQFWNQVDLLFRTLSNPQYKLNIAGIVIPMVMIIDVMIKIG